MPFITGVGLVTPLGDTASTTWEALLAGRYIVDHSPAAGRLASRYARVSELAIRAASGAISQAGWNQGQLASDDTALVVGTSKGPVETWLSPPPGNLYNGLGQIAADVAAELHMSGPRQTCSAACASGLHSLISASMLLRSGICRRALVVAAESSLHPLFIGSFRRLGVLAKPGLGCRPFDEQRHGFLVSESAAAVCLQLEPGGALARVEKFALAGDATHLTGSDPQGRTLRTVLKLTCKSPVDLFHAHGTGTEVNDPVELAAMESVAAGPATVYSHKGALGHSLGAAGLVAVALNCLCHGNGVIPPNVQTHRPIPTSLRISRDALQTPVQRSVALAAGFGGTVAAVSLVSA